MRLSQARPVEDQAKRRPAHASASNNPWSVIRIECLSRAAGGGRSHFIAGADNRRPAIVVRLIWIIIDVGQCKGFNCFKPGQDKRKSNCSFLNYSAPMRARQLGTETRWVGGPNLGLFQLRYTQFSSYLAPLWDWLRERESEWERERALSNVCLKTMRVNLFLAISVHYRRINGFCVYANIFGAAYLNRFNIF